MKNREWLREQSEYDLLCRINEKLSRNTSCVCVMECFMQSIDAERRCIVKNHEPQCSECIQSFLNEERR